MAYEYTTTDLQIYKAASRDDWESVSQLLEECPELMTKRITYQWETPLMTAVGTNRSHRFVNQLLDRIVAIGAANELLAVNYEGNNALHYAAMVGNTITARRLVQLNPEIALLRNYFGNTPLLLAASPGTRDVLGYLMGVTMYSPGREEGISTYRGISEDLLTRTIHAGFLDVALDIVVVHPDILLEYDFHYQSPLQALATKPEFFRSGTRFVDWGRWADRIYPPLLIKKIHDIKAGHIQSTLLVKKICKFVIENINHELVWEMLGSAIAMAVKYGVYELIEECIIAYPIRIWYNVEGFCLFHSAIEQRDVHVYNLVYKMTSYKVFATNKINDEKKENALHIVAKLAPPLRLNVVHGPLLKMQRELQWFKEVENLVDPSYKVALNIDSETPRMVFTNKHKVLFEEAQKWIKDTSSSCIVVATLIVTVAFAGAVTIPGVNQDEEAPLIRNIKVLFFIISDAFALILSSTSVFMFLGIFTSSYEEDDFLHILPIRMTIGILSIFVSLVNTMIALSITVVLVLEDQLNSLILSLLIATTIPLGFFCMFQLPQLAELVNSTFGRSIFHKHNNRRIF